MVMCRLLSCLAVVRTGEQEQVPDPVERHYGPQWDAYQPYPMRCNESQNKLSEVFGGEVIIKRRGQWFLQVVSPCTWKEGRSLGKQKKEIKDKRVSG